MRAVLCRGGKVEYGSADWCAGARRRPRGGRTSCRTRRSRGDRLHRGRKERASARARSSSTGRQECPSAQARGVPRCRGGRASGVGQHSGRRVERARERAPCRRRRPLGRAEEGGGWCCVAVAVWPRSLVLLQVRGEERGEGGRWEEGERPPLSEAASDSPKSTSERDRGATCFPLDPAHNFDGRHGTRQGTGSSASL